MPRKKLEVNNDMEDVKEKDCAVDENSVGLFLVGEIEDRVRKMVISQGIEVEVVTYTISCGTGRNYYVDDFAPNDYYNLHEKAVIPVYIKAYKKKNGEPSYMLKLLKKDVKVTSRGTRF